MGFELIGQVWTETTFRDYLRTVDLSWARGVCLHHTGTPDLDQRPKGFLAVHMENLRSYYRDSLGWSAGPHLFVDDDQIWGMSSLERRGVHAKSFNAHFIGIEVLGNYDRDDPMKGRGVACWDLATSASAMIFERLGVKADQITGAQLKFHRDDPRTSKSCPGTRIDKASVIATIAMKMKNAEERMWGSDLEQNADRADDMDQQQLREAIEAIEWQLTKLKRML